MKAKAERCLRIVALALLAGLGCEPTAVPPIVDLKTDRNADALVEVPAAETSATNDQPLLDDPQPVVTVAQAGERPWISIDQLPWESWYLHYLGGARIGYSHVLISQSSLQKETIEIARKDYLEFSSDGKPARYLRELGSSEQIDGQLKAFSEKVDNDGQITSIAAGFPTLDRNLLLLTTKTGEETASTQIPWVAGTWGAMGVQALLMQDPLEAGETRTALVFVPQSKKIAAATLVAGQPDLTPIPGGRTESLLPVDVWLQFDEESQRSRNWINPQGEIMKTIALSGPNLSTFRAPAEQVERTKDEFALGELLGRSVSISGYDAPVKLQLAEYHVERPLQIDGPPIDLFALIESSGNQTVRSVDPLKILVTVTRAPTAAGLSTTSAEVPPTEQHLAASPLVPSKMPEIEALALRLTGDRSTPQEFAQQLTTGLHETFHTVELSREISDVLQAARQQQGNCVEQAMLLMALLRNRGIPAQVVSGLRVNPEDNTQMVFHMWTEAWLDGQWLPFDATEGSRADLDRIKFFSSPLSGTNPYRAILPVFEAMDHLTVSLKSYE